MNVAVLKLRSSDDDFQKSLNSLLNRDQTLESGVEDTVAKMIADVSQNGDKALFKYTQQFDNFDVEARGLEVRTSRIQQAIDNIPKEQRDALEHD